jgi:hypothetical protein
MLKEAIKNLQRELNALGAKLTVDGDFGPKTEAALKVAIAPKQEPKLPAGPKRKGAFWMATINAMMGMKETDKKLQSILVPYWKSLYGLAYYTLIGTTFAWCGLEVGYVYKVNGFNVPKLGAAAKTWGTAKAGIPINWKRDGIPHGATTHIDHECDCRGGGNHVGFAKGDCSPQDLAKPGATIGIRGGNQSNSVKDSNFKACEICAVHWADRDPNNPPPKITKSNGCSSGAYTPESTR